MNHVKVGRGGEAYAQQQFEQAGYRVDSPPEKKQGDLRVIDKATGEIFKVEVKTSRRGKSGHWQVCINKDKKTRATHADFVVIQLVLGEMRVVTFIIPAWVLASKQKLSWRNPMTPNSKWATYRVEQYRVEQYQIGVSAWTNM